MNESMDLVVSPTTHKRRASALEQGNASREQGDNTSGESSKPKNTGASSSKRGKFIFGKMEWIGQTPPDLQNNVKLDNVDAETATTTSWIEYISIKINQVETETNTNIDSVSKPYCDMIIEFHRNPSSYKPVNFSATHKNICLKIAMVVFMTNKIHIPKFHATIIKIMQQIPKPFFLHNFMNYLTILTTTSNIVDKSNLAILKFIIKKAKHINFDVTRTKRVTNYDIKLIGLLILSCKHLDIKYLIEFINTEIYRKHIVINDIMKLPSTLNSLLTTKTERNSNVLFEFLKTCTAEISYIINHWGFDKTVTLDNDIVYLLSANMLKNVNIGLNNFITNILFLAKYEMITGQGAMQILGRHLNIIPISNLHEYFYSGICPLACIFNNYMKLHVKYDKIELFDATLHYFRYIFGRVTTTKIIYINSENMYQRLNSENNKFLNMIIDILYTFLFLKTPISQDKWNEIQNYFNTVPGDTSQNKWELDFAKRLSNTITQFEVVSSSEKVQVISSYNDSSNESL